MDKGILGVKKDSKSPILYFANGEDWPSDDSKDEDYMVPGEKRSATKCSDKRSSEKKSEKESDVEECNSSSEVSTEAPPIGKFVIKRTSKANGSGSGAKDSFTFRRKRRYKEKEHDVKKRKVEKSEHRKRPKLDTESRDSYDIGKWGCALPQTALLLIFEFVVRCEGVFPFLKRASQVSDTWKAAAEHPALWTQVDVSKPKVSMTEAELLVLCRERFRHARELNLGGWGKKLSISAIKEISETCPHLTGVNLTGCSKVTGSVVRDIVNNCPKLTSIDLSQISENHGSSDSPVSCNSVRYIASKLGDRLVRFSTAGNFLAALTGIVNIFAENFPTLKELDMSNTLPGHGTMSLNVEKLQQGCTKLRVLRLANVHVLLTPVSLLEQAASPGFPELEELSVAKINNRYNQGLDDASFERILKSSHKLKLLDVRGCSHITASGLVRIPAWDLEHLFLSQCYAAITPDLELVMQKWAHSLVQVDLSWNNQSGEVIDSAVSALTTTPPRSPLHMLDLCGSAVSIEPVKSVLLNCPKLSVINLTSCRGLPRGIKRVYEAGDVQKLQELLLRP